jgi:glutathione S-transferase
MVFCTTPDGTVFEDQAAAEAHPLKLYYEWRSTSTRGVRIVLHEKGLDWVGFHLQKAEEADGYQPWYAALNPLGVVPTLIHGDKVIIESNVINEYLEDTFPEVPLRPENPYEKARMRVWLIRSENEAHDAINPISERVRAVRKAQQFNKELLLKQVSACPHPGRRALKISRLEHGIPDEVIETSHQRLAWLLDQMEQSLSDGPWLAGSGYSLADIAMAPFMERFVANGIPEVEGLEDRLPLTADWWKRIQARPSYQFVMSMTSPDETDRFREQQI